MSDAVLARSVRVFLVAQPLVRWGFERLIQTATDPRCEWAGSATRMDESLALVQRERADLVLLVLDEPLTQELGSYCGKCPAKVLLVTGASDHATLDGAVIAGVRGIVRTADAPQILLKAIERVNAGELWIDRGATSRIFVEMARQKAATRNDPERSKIATLTLRERQTIAALASDASAPGKVLADRLCISEHTLRNHLTSIYSKLGLSNRLDLYAYATRHSLHELR